MTDQENERGKLCGFRHGSDLSLCNEKGGLHRPAYSITGCIDARLTDWPSAPIFTMQ
ncbi:hypothetical protein THIOKS1850018 [Thiocapsa sp. KS1]|nr:hypothetical protein THIOKS1850018 [Thiocapsa sp. KS1]